MQSLGLKDGSSQKLGLLDVTSSWQAFEHINDVRVLVKLEPREVNQAWSLWAVGEVWGEFLGEPAAMLLVSESVKCSVSDWESLDTVVFRLMYALDAALALREMGGKRSTA